MRFLTHSVANACGSLSCTQHRRCGKRVPPGTVVARCRHILCAAQPGGRRGPGAAGVRAAGVEGRATEVEHACVGSLAGSGVGSRVWRGQAGASICDPGKLEAFPLTF
eukprot:365249-Chlamydomonas_euryale.AAC.6